MVTVRDLSRLAGVHVDTIRQRLEKGLSVEEVAKTQHQRPQRDLIGQRFGQLVVQSRTRLNGRSAWCCLCDCGVTTTVSQSNLLAARVQSCGCLKRAASQRRARLLLWKGQKRTLEELASLTGVPKEVIRSRLNRGIKLEEALTIERFKPGPRDELIGQQFGWLRVLRRAGNRGLNKCWQCICKCGKEVYRTTQALRSKNRHAISCGCHRSRPLKPPKNRPDLTGRVFGHLTVLSPAVQDLWTCRCVCGTIIQVTSHSITRRHGRRTCGCRPRTKRFAVFDEQLTIKEMAELAGSSVESIRHRINQYEMTPEEAATRQPKTRFFLVAGKRLTLKEMSEQSGMPVEGLRRRINREKMTPEEAIHKRYQRRQSRKT